MWGVCGIYKCWHPISLWYTDTRKYNINNGMCKGCYIMCMYVEEERRRGDG